MKIFVDGTPGVSNSTLCRKTDEQRLGLGSSTNTQFYCHCNRQASGEPHLLKTSFVLMQIWNKKLCSTSSREPPIFQLWTAKPQRKNTLPSHSGNSSGEPVTKLLHVHHFTSTCRWLSSASAQHNYIFRLRLWVLRNIQAKRKTSILVQILKERSDMTSLCYIPLNCSICVKGNSTLYPTVCLTCMRHSAIKK